MTLKLGHLIKPTLLDAYWIMTRQEELNQFELSMVWNLVPKPLDITIFGNKWIFRNNLDNQGTITKNKARLLVQGYNKSKRSFIRTRHLH